MNLVCRLRKTSRLLVVLLSLGGFPAALRAVQGVVPAGMSSHLAVGLFEGPGSTWMKDSGVRWDYRYAYFTKGWVNNWGWGGYDGSWGLAFMQECDQQGFLPAIQYYQMNGESGYNEGIFYQTTKNPTIMASYFGDFKILMQRAKEYGKPVLVMLEADGFAYMEQQSGDNPSAYSAIKDSGMVELQGLPNTAAGWGLAFLQIRKSVGASNVILGVHVSDWATVTDVMYSYDIALQPEVDKAYAFLAPLGLAANVTGSTFDVLVGDPLDRDADYYRVVKNESDRWWDANDADAINTRCFNRYAEWLRLWNLKAGKRWVLWQIPLGNSNHLNVYNNGNAREGYKDNRPEYFFGNGTAHLTKFADVGVVALLFGVGVDGQSTYTNDVYTDGKLFMKTHAGAVLASGSVTLPGAANSSSSSSSGSSSSSSGGSSSSSSSSSSSGGGSSSDPAPASSGGGGGAPGEWFVPALAALALTRQIAGGARKA